MKRKDLTVGPLFAHRSVKQGLAQPTRVLDASRFWERGYRDDGPTYAVSTRTTPMTSSSYGTTAHGVLAVQTKLLYGAEQHDTFNEVGQQAVMAVELPDLDTDEVTAVERIKAFEASLPNTLEVVVVNPAHVLDHFDAWKAAYDEENKQATAARRAVNEARHKQRERFTALSDRARVFGVSVVRDTDATALIRLDDLEQLLVLAEEARPADVSPVVGFVGQAKEAGQPWRTIVSGQDADRLGSEILNYMRLRHGFETTETQERYIASLVCGNDLITEDGTKFRMMVARR